jgi:hypothetical protein
LRKQFGLKKIKIREHNLFLDRIQLGQFLKDYFDEILFINISSQYYIVSRIIYSKICAENSEEPDYFDIHHELASRLPFVGNFGPIGMYHLEKRQKSE